MFIIASATRLALASSLAWSSHITISEMASLNSWCGPAVIAWNGCPNSVKCTTFTDPAGPLGESAGMAYTPSTRESGKMDA